jgi:hypothetical protein
MNTKTVGGLVAALGMAVSVLAGAPAMAEKHDSNTLHKMGNAIQYPVRKAGENLSVDIHRGEHRDSIHSDRPHDRKQLITAEGDKINLHSRRYAHRRIVRHHRIVRRHHIHHHHRWHKK